MVLVGAAAVRRSVRSSAVRRRRTHRAPDDVLHVGDRARAPTRTRASGRRSAGVPGLLLVRAGGPVTGGFVGATDNVIVGIGSTTTESNFEPGDGHVAVTGRTWRPRLRRSRRRHANGSGAFVSGPNGSDGSGSAQLTVDATGGEALANGLFAGTVSTTSLPVVQDLPEGRPEQRDDVATRRRLRRHRREHGVPGSRRVRAEHAGPAPVTNETWQTWNPLTAPSGWWQTGNAIVGGANVGKACTQASPCSFAAAARRVSERVDPADHRSEQRPTGRGRGLAEGRRGWCRVHRQRRLAHCRGQRRRRERHRHLRLRAVGEPRFLSRTRCSA